MPEKIKKRHLLDYGILIPYLVLCVFGLIMVYSSTAYSNLEAGSSPMRSVIAQGVFWVLSLIVITIIYKMKTDVFRNEKFAYLIMIIVIVMLIFVKFFGEEINGAKGWIELGSFSIQPAEFFKIVAIWYLALKLSVRQQSVGAHHLWEAAKRPLVPIAIGLFFIMWMPDFGNASVTVLCLIAIMLASGVNYIYAFLIGIGGVFASYLAILGVNAVGKGILPAHVFNRFATFRNPFADEFNTGHQMVNGYYAIFNGGWFGRGLGNSIQKKGFLQFAQTDYIFAIVVEELGVIVAMIVLGLMFFMIAKMYVVGIKAKDPFNSMMAIGIASLFMFQVFVNLGGITGIIPLTGITFPFISQGGSSLLMLSICVAFVLNVSAEEKRRRYGLLKK